MTVGGEFTGGESSWWRGDRKPRKRVNIQNTSSENDSKPEKKKREFEKY